MFSDFILVEYITSAEHLNSLIDYITNKLPTNYLMYLHNRMNYLCKLLIAKKFNF